MGKCRECGLKTALTDSGICENRYEEIKNEISNNKQILADLALQANPDMERGEKDRLVEEAEKAYAELKKIKDMGLKHFKSDISRPRALVYEKLGLPAPAHARSKTVCSSCGSADVIINTYQESKGAGCGTMLLYFFLAITVLGLFIVIPLMLRKNATRTRTQCVCKKCGHKWYI